MAVGSAGLPRLRETWGTAAALHISRWLPYDVSKCMVSHSPACCCQTPQAMQCSVPDCFTLMSHTRKSHSFTKPFPPPTVTASHSRISRCFPLIKISKYSSNLLEKWRSRLP